MCPRLPAPNSTESAATRELTVIAEWTATARCVIATFRRHLVSRIIICDTCFTQRRPQRQCLYERVVRHYIKLGNYPVEERCSLCDRELAGIISVPEAHLRGVSQRTLRLSQIYNATPSNTLQRSRTDCSRDSRISVLKIADLSLPVAPRAVRPFPKV